MAQPTRYNRAFDFTNWSAANPDLQQPGQNIDGELDSLKVTTDETITNLSKIQRDDGALANGIVTRETLDPSIALGFGTPTPWEALTSYAVSATVSKNSALWTAISAHTSSASWDADVAAGLWFLLVDLSASNQEAIEAANQAAASASAAAASASAASGSATTATNAATTATTQAGNAATKAAEALASKNAADASASSAADEALAAASGANMAANAANNATTQAGVATTKANEATAKATEAANSAAAAQSVLTTLGYQIGTFQPTIGFTTNGNLNVVYGTRQGEFTRIGNLCFVSIAIATTTFTYTTASGNLQISLPFPAAAGVDCVLNIGFQSPAIAYSANRVFITAVAIGGGSVMHIRQHGTGAGTTTLTVTNVPSGSAVVLLISGFYRI